MKLSPLDIRHKEFQSALNGFNKGQVRDFLARAADQYEERLEQILQLNAQIKKQEKEIEELRVSDIELKRTLVTSERLTGEVKLQAEREAELLLKETQSKADIILRDAELQKRQLLKSAELQVEEATEATQKAKEAAKQIRERSMQEAAIQQQRAKKMVAGLKEETANLPDSEVKTLLEAEHAKEINKLRHNSKMVILQLKKDVANLKAERGKMLDQLSAYDRNLEALEHKVADHKVSTPNKTPTLQTQPSETPNKQDTISLNPKTAADLKTQHVANALSSSIDSLMSDSLLSENALGLTDTFGDSAARPTNLVKSEKPKASTPKQALKVNEVAKIAQDQIAQDIHNPHDISYPKMDLTNAQMTNIESDLFDVADEAILSEVTLNETTLYESTLPELKQSEVANVELTHDPMNITVIPLETTRETGRYARERQLEREHRSEHQNYYLQEEQEADHLNQHVYPPYPVKESSVQDRGRLITPPTVYDVENPFIDDGIDELDTLDKIGTFSDVMIQKDTLPNAKGVEFDSNIFDIEDTLELPVSKSTVEHIEVLDTDWFENFELDDD